MGCSTNTFWRHTIGLCLALFPHAAMAQTANPTPVPASPAIELKLFEKAEVDRSKGCSVVLWQDDRDPEKDKFAYLFSEVLTGNNHARQPARIKIASQVVSLTRVATGGRTTGYNLFEYQLYKMPAADDFVVLQLKLAAEEGESVDVTGGTMSIVMKGKPVFRASVKGNAGCNTPAAAGTGKAAAPPSTNNDLAGMFQRYPVDAKSVPRKMLQEAGKKFGCEAATMRGRVTGFQMSEESAIWQIPCGTYDKRTSAVFALVYLTDPAAQYEFLPFKWPKGQNRGLGEHAMMAPQWDMRTRMVTSVYTEGNGKDCGSLERHKVTPEGGFQLVELRSRDACDGKSVGAENFPVVFKAK
jgi:hypothetical protein